LPGFDERLFAISLSLNPNPALQSRCTSATISGEFWLARLTIRV